MTIQEGTYNIIRHYIGRRCLPKTKGSVDYAECGVQSVENVECGKCGVWTMQSVENAECGKCGVCFINL